MKRQLREIQLQEVKFLTQEVTHQQELKIVLQEIIRQQDQKRQLQEVILQHEQNLQVQEVILQVPIRVAVLVVEDQTVQVEEDNTITLFINLKNI